MSKPVLLIATLALFASSASASSQAIVACNADKIKEAMNACDSLVNISQIKCDTTACHKALHLLVDDEYLSCYEELKLGSKSDLAKYKELDDFCHGEGPDPLEKSGGSETGNSTSAGSSATDKKEQSVTAAPTTVPAPTQAPTAKPSSGAASLACGTAAAALAVGVASLV